MAAEKDARAARVRKAQNLLDGAVCAYMEAVGHSGIVTSWTMAVGTALVEEKQEFDGFRTASSEGISRWTAIGLLRTALKSAENDGYIRTTTAPDDE